MQVRDIKQGKIIKARKANYLCMNATRFSKSLREKIYLLT